MSPDTPLFDQVARIAGELAAVARASGRPDDALSAFVSALAEQHHLDVRRVRTFAEQWAEANRPRTDAEIRAIYDRARAEFTPADAEALLHPTEPIVPGEQLLAELEEIQRQYDAGTGRAAVTPADPPPPRFQVGFLDGVARAIRDGHHAAARDGFGPTYVAAVREVVERLTSAADTFGEEQFDLPDAQIQVRQAVVRPVVVGFGVHYRRPIVVVRTFRLLTSD